MAWRRNKTIVREGVSRPRHESTYGVVFTKLCLRSAFCDNAGGKKQA